MLNSFPPAFYLFNSGKYVVFTYFSPTKAFLFLKLVHLSVDDSQMSNVPTVSNVSQDLTEWQAKHASLVLSTVKVLLLINRISAKMNVGFSTLPSTHCGGTLIFWFIVILALYNK